MISLDRSFTFGQTSANDKDLYMSGLSICFEKLLLVLPIVQAFPRPNYAGTVGQHCPHSHCMQVTQAEPKKSTKLKCYMKILICSAKILGISFRIDILWHLV